MDKDQLEKALRACGKATFVMWLERCRSGYENALLVEEMMEEHGYTKSSAATKVSTIRRILRESLEEDALRIIIESRVDEDAIEKARSLLKK